MNTALGIHLAERVTALSLDLHAPFNDLHALTHSVRQAQVAALGSAVRQSRELSTLTHRIMRFLIDRHDFRSLLLEGDEKASIELDAFVRTGEGDPAAILVRARPFWRFAEILAAVRWVRARNERDPGDPVRIVHVAGEPPGTSPSD